MPRHRRCRRPSRRLSRSRTTATRTSNTSEPITYWERRRAGEFEAAAAERAAQLAAEATPTVSPEIDERTHVPLGADVELYDTMSEWASSLAGFMRFDFDPTTEGLIGPPGITLLTPARGDVVFEDWVFVTEVWDGTQPTLYVGTARQPQIATHALDALSVWTGSSNAVVGASLLGIAEPKAWIAAGRVRVYVGDNQGQPPGSTVGQLSIILRLLPAPPGYPA